MRSGLASAVTKTKMIYQVNIENLGQFLQLDDGHLGIFALSILGICMFE